MFRTYLILIAVIIIGNVNASIWIKNVKSYGPSATIAAKNCLAIMTKYYFREPTLSRSQNLVVVYAKNLSVPAENIQNSYLSWVHAAIYDGEITDIELQIISNNLSIRKLSKLQTHEIYENDYYLLVMDNMEKFTTLMRQYVSRAAFNPGAKFIILYINTNILPTTKTENELAFQLFQLMYNRHNAANVIFLYAVDTNAYNIYVTNPYMNTNECGSLRPIQLDVCKNGTLTNEKSTKLWAMQSRIPKVLPNCTFKFCARVSAPYIDEGCQTGLETKIISVLRERLEFKIKTFCINNMDRGEPQTNGSWDGILGMLRGDQCDFVVGGFFPDNDVHDDFGVTTSYLQDAYTWYVYISKKQPQWLAMLTVFEIETWLLSLGILVISGVCWYLFGSTMPEKAAHKDGALCGLNSWCVFLGIASNNQPLWGPLRIFFISLAFYALNLTTIYNSKLIRVFTHPQLNRQIDTLEEIIESNLPLGGREEYDDWFDNDSPLDAIILKRYNTSMEFWPSVENLKHVARGERVIFSNRIFVLSKSIHNVFALPQDAITSPLEMISERGFPLLRRYSKLIHYMIDAGIMSKLLNDFLYDVTVLQHIRDHDPDAEISQTVLTLSHMDGAFTVLLLGCVVSFMVFIAELFTAWYLRRRRSKRLWKLLKNSWRQVSIMRQIQSQHIKKKPINDKWTANKSKKSKKGKVRFKTSTSVFSK